MHCVVFTPTREAGAGCYQSLEMLAALSCTLLELSNFTLQQPQPTPNSVTVAKHVSLSSS